MSQKILKGIQMDDKFNAVMTRVQKAIEDLHVLHRQFDENSHRPAPSQTSQLTSAKGQFQELTEMFMKLKAKS